MPRQDSKRFPTFRLPYSFTPAIGVAIEIFNPAGSGNNLRLRRVNMRNATAGAITAKRISAKASGGTAANLTPVGSDTSQVSVVTAGNARSFTVAPTPGTTIDTVIQYVAPTTPISEQLSDDEAEPIILKPGEGLSVEAGASSLWTGYFLWTEELIAP